MEITVNIHGLDSLAQAIAAMAQAIRRGQGGTLAATAAPAAQAPIVPHAAAATPAPATAAVASAAPAPPAPAPPAPPAPTAPTEPVPTAPTLAAPAAAVPLATAPQQYTLAELQKAVMPLLDAGRMADLQQVLAKYGAQDLTRVPAEQYGALAADFRALGARL
nr:MAG TPA: activated protein kinase C receptor [Caudoviricetes sp.]